MLLLLSVVSYLSYCPFPFSPKRHLSILPHHHQQLLPGHTVSVADQFAQQVQDRIPSFFVPTPLQTRRAIPLRVSEIVTITTAPHATSFADQQRHIQAVVIDHVYLFHLTSIGHGQSAKTLLTRPTQITEGITHGDEVIGYASHSSSHGAGHTP